MTRFNFDNPPDRHHTASVKWDRYGGRDVLPMWVADMDFEVPPAVTAALQQRVAHGLYGYTHASEGLVQAFCKHAEHHYGWQVEPDWLAWIPGAVPALHVACDMIEPGHKVVTTSPIYPPFRSAPGQMQRERIGVPLAADANGRPQRDLAALDQAFADNGKLLLLCNPHNPGGQVANRQELEAIATSARAHDTLVVADELHADLILEPGLRHQPFAALSPQVAARSITLMAPSKTFNLAGLGLTCAIIPDANLRRRFQQAISGILPFPNTLSYTAGEAAWRDGWAWHAQLIQYLRGNRDLITAHLAALPQIRAYPPEATYLYWLDLRASGHDQPVKHLEAHGLGLSDGADFGAPGFARLNFACPRATLSEALQRLTTALA